MVEDVLIVDSINPLPFPLDIETIMKAIVSFPNSSGGGFDGLLPQHLKDLSSESAGEGGQLLRGALVGLATLIFEGRTPAAIQPYFFAANLMALRKKGGGVRPIAVGCTLRRLASKCASLHILKTISHLLAPHQLGFGIPRGVEATVHATRIYLNNISPHQALLKVDFRNAFNSIRRDKMLTAVRDFIPELLPYVHSAYSSPSILLWDDVEVNSSEGVQQGDPIGPLLFCLTIHKLISNLKAEFNVFYLDDGTIGGKLDDIFDDLKSIEEKGKEHGLHLNVEKSELISHDPSSVEVLLSSFPGLQFVNANDATLLGSSLGDIASINETLEAKTNQLKLIGERLCYLHSHDAITLLRHSFAIPKLLHILRTSPAFLSPTLLPFDQLLMSIVSQITNIHFHIDDPAWMQATLPVGSGGLGLRSAALLAPSDFLASAVGASSLIEQLLPPHLQKTNYIEQDLALLSWRECLPPDSLQPESPTSHLQKAWDKPRVQSRWDSLFSNCVDPQARARLMAAQTKESGAWLNALPVSSLGLRMSDDTLHIAIGLRLGTPFVYPTSVPSVAWMLTT